MQKKNSLLAEISLFFFLFLGIFLPGNAAEQNPMYQEIENLLQEVENEISAAESGKEKCDFAFGYRAEMELKQTNITFWDTIMDTWEGKEKSICYAFDAENIDERIMHAMKNFRATKDSCVQEKAENFVQRMKKILEKRKELRFDKTSKSYYREKCSENPQQEIFSETVQAWNSFEKKLGEIERALKELKASKHSPASRNEEERKKNDLERTAAQNAQEYYEQFWSNFDITKKMREARAKINRSLKGLPSGKSTFVQVENELGKQTEEKNELPEKKLEYQKKSWNETDPLLESRSEILERLDQEEKMFQQSFATNMEILEQVDDFQSPLSTVIVDSLEPFHETTIDTTFHLEALSDALRSVLARQNIEK